jgi:hypothetical protein
VTDAPSTCNSCDGPVEHPSPAGYCDSCAVGAEVSTRTGLRIWSACATEGAARRYAAAWAEGAQPFEVCFREDLSAARPWVVYAAADAGAVAGSRAADGLTP